MTKAVLATWYTVLRMFRDAGTFIMIGVPVALIPIITAAFSFIPADAPYLLGAPNPTVFFAGGILIMFQLFGGGYTMTYVKRALLTPMSMRLRVTPGGVGAILVGTVAAAIVVSLCQGMAVVLFTRVALDVRWASIPMLGAVLIGVSLVSQLVYLLLLLVLRKQGPAGALGWVYGYGSCVLGGLIFPLPVERPMFRFLVTYGGPYSLAQTALREVRPGGYASMAMLATGTLFGLAAALGLAVWLVSRREFRTGDSLGTQPTSENHTTGNEPALRSEMEAARTESSQPAPVPPAPVCRRRSSGFTVFRYTFVRAFRDPLNIALIVILPLALAFLPEAVGFTVPIGYQSYGAVILFGAFLLLRPVVEDGSNGTLERIGAAPVTRMRYLVQTLTANAIILVSQNAIMVAIGVVFHGEVLPVPGLLVVAYAVFSVASLALCLAGAAIFRRRETTYQALSLVLGGMAALSGFFWPIEFMPVAARRAAMATPGYWLLDAIRTLESAGPSVEFAVSVAIMVLFSGVFLLTGSTRRLE